MDDELKVKIQVEPDDSSSAKGRFQKDVQKIADETKNNPPKIAIDIDTKSIKKQWDGIFKETIKNLTAPNVDLNPLKNQYKQQEKWSDDFHRKNLSGIDAEIQRQKTASQHFSKQLKEQMLEKERQTKLEIKNINDIAKAQALHDKKYSEAKKFGFNNSAFNKNSGLKSEYQSIMGDYDTLIGSDDVAAMNALNSKFDVFKRKVSEAGLLGQTFTDKLGAQMNKLGVYFTAAGLMMGAFNQVKNMIKDVIELDGAMTELKKVTDETDATYSKFLDNAESRAKRLGSTLTDTITATADFARLGFNLSDSEKIADAALVYKNVGDGIKDVSQASESIISTMKAFGFEASHTMEIVDRFNKVGNNFAISSKDVGEGLKRSASALSVAGNSVDQSIALLVAGNNVVQDVDVVATALKTSALRLTNTKGKLEELGEDADGAAESITKLQTQILNLTKGKVDIMLNEDTFKSTYDIMLGMSKIWDSMNQKDQMTALDLMFGKRGANVGSSIITNMSDAEKVLSDSINSSGSALAENEKVLDSIQGKLSQFTAQYEALSNSVVNSELIKGVVDSGTGLLGTLTAIIDKVKILPTLITVAAGALSGLTNKGGYAPFTKIAV